MLRVVDAIVDNEYKSQTTLHVLADQDTDHNQNVRSRKQQRRQTKVQAARLSIHFSSIKYNLSPSFSKNAICDSDPVQRGTIESWATSSIVNTFHLPIAKLSAIRCGERAKARW